MNTDEAVRVAERLGLTPTLTDIVSGGSLPAPFDLYVGFPEEFYMMSSDELQGANWQQLIPMWEDGSFDLLVAYHRTRETLVSFYVEENIEPQDLPALNPQQALFPNFFQMVDGGVLSSDQVHEAAELLGFRFIDRLMAEHHRAHAGDAWHDQFQESLAEVDPT